jgi:hypothetical protein
MTDHRPAFALAAIAALAACSSIDPSRGMSARDPYVGSMGPSRYDSSYSDVFGGSAVKAGLVPPMDSSRKVTEQDCSKPVALDQANLRCK